VPEQLAVRHLDPPGHSTGRTTAAGIATGSRFRRRAACACVRADPAAILARHVDQCFSSSTARPSCRSGTCPRYRLKRPAIMSRKEGGLATQSAHMQRSRLDCSGGSLTPSSARALRRVGLNQARPSVRGHGVEA
jgi:hypothetical protein